MLTMDLQHLTKAQLVDAVCQHCGQFGGVNSVAILQPPEKPGLAFALVTMDRPENLNCLVDQLADGKVSSLAIIKIEDEQQRIPVSLLKKSPAHAALSARA